ncbi:MAG: methionine adenosyltransferase [candidate division WOR-3 bacterium]
MIVSKNLFTSESVTEGHPDKLCDQISDAVLDEVLRQDRCARVACETFVTVGLVVVGGEITTSAWVDLQRLVRNLLADVGYVDTKYGLSAESCAVLNAISTQSPDIAQGVDRGGAGDQGVMFGYACRETPEFMPLPILMAHRLARRLAEVRRKRILPYLGPDGKTQVTIEYQSGIPVRVDNIVLATQHTAEILDRSGERIREPARREIIEAVVPEAVPPKYLDRRTEYFVNETGKFLAGGPQSDTGMTGRKLIVDTYGGWVRHGGGAFSGKDPTKVDRSASYYARYVAKNCVAAGLADELEVRLAYCIGRAEPTQVVVDSKGTGKLADDDILEIVLRCFDFRPAAMIEVLMLQRPIYLPTAVYGHFGRSERTGHALGVSYRGLFTWENTDKVATIRRAAKL